MPSKAGAPARPVPACAARSPNFSTALVPRWFASVHEPGCRWQALQASFRPFLPERCATCEPFAGGFPWQVVQELACVFPVGWHVVHATLELPPVKSAPWHFAQYARSQLWSLSSAPWNSCASLGFKMPPACGPTGLNASRPSTTHAFTSARLSALSDRCGLVAVAGASVTSSFEVASPATATGAALGPSASRYEVVR